MARGKRRAGHGGHDAHRAKGQRVLPRGAPRRDGNPSGRAALGQGHLIERGDKLLRRLEPVGGGAGQRLLHRQVERLRHGGPGGMQGRRPLGELPRGDRLRRAAAKGLLAGQHLVQYCAE